MIPLVGYAERLSVRPGETLRFHVSNATGATLEAPRILRVISADPNPAGPRILTEPTAADVRSIAECGAQTTLPGFTEL